MEGGKWPPSLYSRTYRILEDLYESSPVLYCTVSANGIILDCNGTYAKRIGYSRAESIGTPIFDHVGPNSMVAMHEYLEIWQKIGILENFEVWLRRKDGDVFPALMNAASVHDEHGNVVACNIVLIDQTDIYKTKKDVERANEELKVKEQLKNEFIAIASHEPRTPIQPLLGYAVLAKKGKVSQEAAWEAQLTRFYDNETIHAQGTMGFRGVTTNPPLSLQAIKLAPGAYRIDIGVRHRDRPGVYLAGIECDGAAYHAAPCARPGQSRPPRNRWWTDPSA